ncbi:MAG TPA: hypothetical protein VMM93_04105 [Vicinamibacterales bacterium]|nr:hypothetical protein [Vicinamibacterales bacterium]
MKKTARTRKHPGRPGDAIALAAFRNFALDVERLLVRIYVTRPDTYETMVEHMRRVLAEIYRKGTQPKRLSDDRCPPGYELCADGLCAEVCDILDADAAFSPASASKRVPRKTR